MYKTLTSMYRYLYIDTLLKISANIGEPTTRRWRYPPPANLKIILLSRQNTNKGKALDICTLTTHVLALKPPEQLQNTRNHCCKMG